MGQVQGEQLHGDATGGAQDGVGCHGHDTVIQEDGMCNQVGLTCMVHLCTNKPHRSMC